MQLSNDYVGLFDFDKLNLLRKIDKIKPYKKILSL